MTNQTYFVSLFENQTAGPLTHEQVQAMVLEGKISEMTWTWTESSGDWLPFSDFREFDSDDREEDPEDSELASDSPLAVDSEPLPDFVQVLPMAHRPVIEIGRVKGNPEEPWPEETLPPWETDQRSQPEDRTTAEDQPEAEACAAIELGPDIAQWMDEDSIELPPQAADEPPPEIISALTGSLEHGDDRASVGATAERSEDNKRPSKGDVRFISAEVEVLREQDAIVAECISCATKVTRCSCCGEILILAPVASRRSA